MQEALPAGLRVELEAGPPASLPVGQGTAAFCFGTCFHPRSAISRLEVLVDGRPQPVTAHGMPRMDLVRALHPQRPEMAAGSGFDPDSEVDPELRCYRSGFWATITIPARQEMGETVRVLLRAGLESGGEAVVEIARIAIAAPPKPIEMSAPAGSGASIAVCMPTYNPEPRLFKAQVDSLRRQSDEEWICIVSDDCSQRELFAGIERELEGDDRFVLVRNPRRLGFYRNFERALELVPTWALFVALCDQDDRWYPDKLSTLRRELGRSMLAYSDQRLVDAAGEVVAETYWTSRRNNHTDLTSMLLANTVTGAASMMHRSVVERALPFPSVPGEQYHDHWLALVAMSMGELAYVDRPLYDYVQHAGAALGHAAANAGTESRLRWWREQLRRPGVEDLIPGSASVYFRAYVRLQVLAQALLVRGGAQLPPRKSRALRGFVAAERSVRWWLWLRLRALRGLVGRNETFGIERLVARGILWRYAIGLLARFVGPRTHEVSVILPEPVHPASTIDPGPVG